MSDELLQSLRSAIRTVPDFPLEGVMFRDITPVLGDPGLMSGIIALFARDTVSYTQLTLPTIYSV